MKIAILLALPTVAIQDGLEQDGKKVKIVDEWFHSSTKVKDTDCRRISTKTEWKEFWAEHSGKKEDLEKVDFRKNMILVFPMQTYFGCLRPQVTKTQVRETKRALRLVADLEQGGCNNNMHGHPVGMGRSILIVVVPKSDKKVDFCLAKIVRGKRIEPSLVQSLPAVED
jgi:hypothetical protein